jgi:NMD protein affecting ribosome stability and mRNA decay
MMQRLASEFDVEMEQNYELVGRKRGSGSG